MSVGRMSRKSFPRVTAPLENPTVANRHRENMTAVALEDVAQRQETHPHIPIIHRQGGFDIRAQADEAAMWQHRSLGVPGRAAGVNDRRDVLLLGSINERVQLRLINGLAVDALGELLQDVT